MNESKDINSLIDEASDLLELLKLSGVDFLPKPEKTMPACVGAWSVSQGEISITACPAHNGFVGLAAGLWKMSESLTVLAVSGFTDEAAPFSGGEGEQLKRIIDWMAKETGAAPFDSITPVIFYAGACVAVFDPNEALNRIGPLIKKEAEKTGAGFIAAFGESAAVFTGKTPQRGKFFEYDETLIMPTHAIAELVKKPGLKKDTMEDMKSVIKKIME